MPYPAAILLGAAAYFLAAELGLAFAGIHKSVSPVWPASGIAVALLIAGGRRMWPAIWIGGWLAGILVDGPVTIFTMSTGDTLEALIGAEILMRLGRYRADTFSLARGAGYLAASIIAPVIGAAIGTVTLCWQDALAGQDAMSLFITWWASDALGILILAPALLSLMTPVSVSGTEVVSSVLFRRRLAILGAAALLSLGLSAADPALAVAIFLAFPIVLLSIRWFGKHGGAWLTLLMAMILLAQTAAGFGAFAVESLNGRLLDVQVFIGALAFTALVFTDLQGVPLRLAGWVFGIGIAVAMAVFALSERVETDLAREHFNKIAEAATDGIRQRLEIYADSLHAGSAFVAASPQVSRRDWRDYAASLDLLSRYPGVNGIGLIVPVPPAELDRFVAAARQDDAADFAIKAIPDVVNPRSVTEDHLVILYAEPVAANNAAIGLDLSTEESRRHAALTAKDLAQPQITDPIKLVQDVKQRSGFLLFVPIYKPGLPMQTAAQHAAAFRGWIYAPFVADVFFREALKNWDQQVEMQIFNGAAVTADPPLFASTPPPDTGFARSRDYRDLSLVLFGHPFTARVWPGEALAIEGQRTGIVLGAGLAMLATLMAALIANLQSMKDHARVIANQMTEALAISTERFELAIAGSQDGIWDWNLEDGTFWVSARCREMLGYGADEVVDNIAAWRSYLHPDDLAPTAEAMRALIRHATLRLDIIQRFQHRDGHFIYLHNRALAIYRDNGRATRIIGALTDITPLQRAEERLRTAVAVMDNGLALFDAEDRLVLFNEGFMDENLRQTLPDPTGHTAEEIFASFAYGALTAVEALPDRAGWLKRRMDLHRTPPAEPFEIEWTDGSWMRVFERRLSDGGTVAIWTDITAQKQRETELELAKQQLEAKTIELTKLAEDLDRARRVADEANRGKSRFLANTSHELRTPLTAILGFSDVMSSEIFGVIQPPIYREYIDLIHESGEHLLSLINDILDLSKIEAGKMTLDIRVVPTADLLRQSSSLMRVMATERGIDLVLDAAPDCPILHGDERAARQIILNLLSNAIKFTPRGGRVTVAVRALGEAGVEISVTDTGIGMTPDEAERALQLYVQVDSDVARMALGTGIGLPLVKALVELHGGAIDVRSRKRYGTTVTVQLPWQAGLSREMPQSSMPPVERDHAVVTERANRTFVAANAFHILVVEDNEINQSLITVILNRMSLQVDCASDGLTGVEMAAAKRYDLVIMDVQMPRLDGIEATRQIRALPGDTSLAPIIALTADAEGQQRERCLAAGMTEVLAKPIVPPLLTATVSRLLQKRADIEALVV